MLVLGNGSSFLGRYLGDYFTPIANSIGVNTTWNFFSPDPAHIMFIRYIVHYEDEYGNPIKEAEEKFYPDYKDESRFYLHERRQNYMMRFMAINPARTEQLFIPWVCKQHPKANRIQFSMILKRIPALDKVLVLKSTAFKDQLQTEEMNQNVYNCQK